MNILEENKSPLNNIWTVLYMVTKDLHLKPSHSFLWTQSEMLFNISLISTGKPHLHFSCQENSQDQKKSEIKQRFTYAVLCHFK